ncbi:DUF5671 domain-containing protein [Pseudoxanthomonas winnipegensis]|uniref:DUF5671 domain-containing protein n=1 Tax=Pseudoxanthomonas winnipegensis TaxID=2480810 RepID=UPI003F82F8F6
MGTSTDLDRFVRDALLAGQSRQAIRAVLLQAGWSPEQLANVLDDYAEVDFPVPVPRPRASLSARDAFMYLVLFSLLYFLCYHLGSLLFDMINAALPDPADDGARLDFFACTRFSTAALVIAFPAFAWLAGRLHREIRQAPIKRLSPVRRWLTYLTLFVSTLTLIGDMTALVYNLLSGEITWRFLLKVLVVAAIAGSVFGYYLRDLRSDEASAASALPLGRRLLLIGGLLAIGAVVGGFVLTGGPVHQRALRMDQRRVSDLQDIVTAVQAYATEHRRLPASLADMAAQPGVGLATQDPVSAAPYSYTALGPKRVRLCAAFETDTADKRPRRPWMIEAQWAHGVGRTCFERDIELPKPEDAQGQAAAQP